MAMVREIVLSDRISVRAKRRRDSDDPPADGEYLIAIMKPLAAEQFAYATMQATGYTRCGTHSPWCERN